jgi:hypothetical protein
MTLLYVQDGTAQNPNILWIIGIVMIEITWRIRAGPSLFGLSSRQNPITTR